MTQRKLAAAIALILGVATSPLMAAVCKPNAATPFSASAPDAVNGFPRVIADSEGVSLVICNPLSDPGNVGGCFFDPVIPGNAFSEAIGFGAEGFWFLSEANFADPQGAGYNVLIVMGAEAAFAAENPAQGEQFPFTRLRVRIDAPVAGVYKLTHPYGSKEWVVTAPGRRAINDTADIQFFAAPNVVLEEGDVPARTNQGVVGPWLRWSTSEANGLQPGEQQAPAGFLGDGATPHTVVGSPCGTNYAELTVTDLVTGAEITRFRTDRFTVQGLMAPDAERITPLVIDNAYYSKNGSQVDLHVFTTAPTTASVNARAMDVTPTGEVEMVAGPLLTENTGRFYQSFRVSDVGNLPESVIVQASNLPISPARSQRLAVTDLVTIGTASASCAANTTNCTVNVTATSSDPDAQLTLDIGGGRTFNASAAAGASFTVTGLSGLPARVKVSSDRKGSASKPLTIN
ncbi:hypothetical protein [Sphaerotilus mobilis]|uniref:Uncharacterized protein n=1 Tax=Sphaerotilus mobilis TaxID=47994 RepID=A0A4Q7LVN2_9BURK|nr:hypothetical protein [Sphaerotilus mobilis]RZS58028.1 hypothetical protein EV685_0305 [Sphaerotilus mobilis]